MILRETRIIAKLVFARLQTEISIPCGSLTRWTSGYGRLGFLEKKIEGSMRGWKMKKYINQKDCSDRKQDRLALYCTSDSA